jgi:Mrp family chromosome partitioning ATPase
VEHLPNARRIAVSSANPGEGKSFCALNLCLALVAGGAKSVLLVEANLQNPTLADWIGFTPPRCFADWLLNAAQEPEAPFRAVEVCFPNCHVLAVDHQTPKPPGLLGLSFEIASRQLCFSDYQYIIVDTPAVFGSADTALIADSVDGVILCAAKGRTTKSRFREAAKQLEPVPILGTVLTES